MNLVIKALLSGMLCIAIWAAYNVFLHPLRRFPGPLASRASFIPKTHHLLHGTLPFHVADLHAQYGPVVRIAPNELSFTDVQAWKDIYTRRPGAHEFAPDKAFYNVTDAPTTSLLGCHREKHDLVRRLLAPGFSERAMKAQEPIINSYVSLLMRRLRENCTAGDGSPSPLNMTDWIAYTTFDIIGTLAFGSDFGCLDGSGYHPWVKLVCGTVKNIAALHALKALGILPPAIRLMRAFKIGNRQVVLHGELAESKTRQRVALGTGRSDLLDELVRSGMHLDELKENGSLLIIAGSETTATLLTGALYLLTTHRDVLDKLTAHVRSSFTSEEDITLTSVTKLTYMLAVLKECLRYYPPTATAAPRITPAGGAGVAGEHIPGGTKVGVWQWAVYRDARHFANPDVFDPERFASPGGGRYEHDRLDAVNPFLLGPRNCVGQNLAYAEMRLVLARLVWGFDMELGEGGRGWMEGQRNYLFWEKPPLEMYLRPVVGEEGGDGMVC